MRDARGSPSARAAVLALLLLAPVAAAAVPAGSGPGAAWHAVDDAATPLERVIVALPHPLTSSERAALLARGITPLVETHVTPALVATVPRGAPFATALPPGARVQVIEPLEFHLDGATRLVRAPAARATFDVTGAGITVAVIDSGVDATHPDLRGRVLENLRHVDGRFVPAATDANGHGTHVASIIAGDGQASGGEQTGVAPGARIVGLDITTSFDTAAALDAFDWVFVNKDRFDIRVVVAAWGRQTRGEPFDPDDALARAADRLVRAGVTVVFSASNHGPGPSTLSFDAQNPNVITVGAVDDAGVIGPYSSRGPARDANGEASWVKPDFVAAGSHVLAARAATRSTLGGPADLLDPGTAPRVPTTPGAPYTTLTGTSQAAPAVAGVVALMLQANPSLTPADVTNALRATAVDLGGPGPDSAYGFGLVDAADALRAARALPPLRDHVLLAGGTATFSTTGKLTGAPRALGATGLFGTSGTEATARLDFPLPANALTGTASFTWSPPADGAYRLFLTDGSTTLGPWSRAATERSARDVTFTFDARDMRAGEWSLVATGPTTGDVAYDATVEVAHAARPELASALDDRYLLPDATPRDGFAAWWQHRSDVAAVEGKRFVRDTREWLDTHPLVLAGFLLGGMAGIVALGVTLRRR